MYSYRGAVNLSLILFAQVIWAGAAQGVEVESHIAGQSSCYTGEWGSEEAYLARPMTKKAYEDPVQLGRAKARYQFWRDNFDCQWITYPVDDLDIQGFLVTPVGEPPEGGWPVVIFNHGGNADIGEVRFQYIAARLFPLVADGFVVLGSQYRGTKIADTPNPDRLRDEFGGADVNDVRALVSIAENLNFADASRIGMWGMSRGGMMTFIAARNSSDFDALVVEGTPVDEFKSLERLPFLDDVFRTWVPGYEEDRENVVRARSAIFWLEDLSKDMPILILHGTHDKRVRADQALALASRLQELEHPYKLVMFEGGGHGLNAHHAEMIREVRDWFAKKLKGDMQVHPGPTPR